MEQSLLRMDNVHAAWLLLLLPLLWLGWKNLSQGMGTLRACVAVTVRSLLVLILVIAIGEPYWVKHSSERSVLFILDRSLSVATSQLTLATEVITGQLRTKRNSKDCKVGILSFGKNPSVESPVDELGLDWKGEFGTSVNRKQTDLESALKLAEAMMPDKGLRRIVVVSDGAETTGDSLPTAKRLTDQGVGIDVLALADARKRDVVLEKLVAPQSVRVSAPFEIRVLLNYLAGDDTENCAGQLEIVSVKQSSEQNIVSQQITLQPGINVLNFQHQQSQPGFYAYRARFTPQDQTCDRFEMNNQFETAIRVVSAGRVLIVRDSARASGFDWIVDLLRAEEIEVDVRGTPLNFSQQADIQGYDLVILADIPRYLNGDPSGAESIPLSALDFLRQSVESTGGGLLVIGGPSSFGNGDWKETPVEDALPVRFDVKNDKVQAATAIELVIDSSGSMDGEKIRLSRAAAREAVRNLKTFDYIGVITFDSQAKEVVKLQLASARELIGRMIGQIGSGGGTNLDPAMRLAYQRLRSSPAAVKHMVILTDGRTEGAGYESLASQMHNDGISITCMAIGTDADERLLSSLAMNAGGQFYKILSPRAIPSIVISETRRVARPLIFESNPFRPHVAGVHPILNSIPRQLPPITGLVLTSPKDSGLVENLIMSPLPVGEDYPVLSTWHYGLGRSAAWTTDAGQRWSSDWINWEGRTQLMLQLSRWLMRSEAPPDHFQLTSNRVGDQTELTLLALDKDGSAINGLSPVVSVLAPNGKSELFSLKQLGPGRYQTLVAAEEIGTYFASAKIDQDNLILRNSFTNGYSKEFNIDVQAVSRLERLAGLKPLGGEPGKIASIISSEKATASFPIDFFRSGLLTVPSESIVWPLLVLCGAVLLIIDVANRKIAWTELRVLERSIHQTKSQTSKLPASQIAEINAAILNQNKPTNGGNQPTSVANKSEVTLSTHSASLVDPQSDLPSYAERLKQAKSRTKR